MDSTYIFAHRLHMIHIGSTFFVGLFNEFTLDFTDLSLVNEQQPSSEQLAVQSRANAAAHSCIHTHTAAKHAMKHERTHTRPDGPVFLLCLKPAHLLENQSCSAPGPIETTAVIRESSFFLVLQVVNLSEGGKKK